MLADTANLHTFVDAVRFIEHNPGFLATKAPDSSNCSSAFVARKPGLSPMNRSASRNVCALAASKIIGCGLSTRA